MRIPVPWFVPVPTPETIRGISIVLLTAGICLAAAAFLLFLSRGRAGEQNGNLPWMMMGTAVLLILNHGIQLLLF